MSDAIAAVMDSTGRDRVRLESLPQTLSYNGDGTVASITVTDGSSTWVQTFTYTAGNLTGIGPWVKQ